MDVSAGFSKQKRLGSPAQRPQEGVPLSHGGEEDGQSSAPVQGQHLGKVFLQEKEEEEEGNIP